jgi:hypothetical protein
MKIWKRPERIEKAIENEENILVLAIMMLHYCCFTRFYLKPITLMLLPIYRIVMNEVTAFHLKELTLQMTMVFAYYRF